MKKTVFMLAMVFVVGLGTAYSADFNGITDFSGRTNDRFEIETGSEPVPAYESSAPGIKRGIEDFNTTGKAYDTGEIDSQAPAKRGMRQNWGAKNPSYNAYDTFEIPR